MKILLLLAMMGVGFAQTKINPGQIGCPGSGTVASAMIVIPTGTNTSITLCVPLGNSLAVINGKLEVIALASQPVKVVSEVPTGAADGTNSDFTLATTPLPNTLRVYRNGVRQKPTVDYALGGNVVHFQTSLLTGDTVLVDYEK